jgi:hypothetical protein
MPAPATRAPLDAPLYLPFRTGHGISVQLAKNDDGLDGDSPILEFNYDVTNNPDGRVLVYCNRANAKKILFPGLMVTLRGKECPSVRWPEGGTRETAPTRLMWRTR